MRLVRLAITLASTASLIPSLAGCVGGQVPVAEKSPEYRGFDGRLVPFGALIQQRLGDTRNSIRTEIGTPAADTIADCGIIPVGTKVCGGPTGYLIYSRKVSDETRLSALASSYTEAERDWNRASGAASDCSLLMPPDVVIVDGQCKASYKKYSDMSNPAPDGW